jgi:DNA-binding PadR family transcriptional regulator
MLELAILGLLDENDLHGYELRKRLGDPVGLRLAISFGSLYPALSRLERHGLVEVVSGQPGAAPPRSPMSGSLAGELAVFGSQRRAAAATTRGARGKKVYGITEAGRRRLVELLSDPDVSDDRAFPVRVAFCRNLAGPERLALFERRRAELARRAGERGTATGSDGRVNTYLRSLLERDSAALAADLAWLDRPITAERQALEPAATTTDPQEDRP